jgi:multidrug resistance protein
MEADDATIVAREILEKMASLSDSSSSSSSSLSSPADQDHDLNNINNLEKASTQQTNHSNTASATHITTAQDWTGPNDPGNPRNWSFVKKMYHVAIIGLQCFSITMGSSVISPALREISEAFDVSITVSILPLTVYVLGLAFGPMISAPISETVGRKPVYMILFPISLLFTLGAGFSSTFASLCICRFFAGLVGSGGLAVGGGTNADLFGPKDRATASSAFLLAAFLGPAIGPPVGGFVAMLNGWRWTQWTILFIGAFTYLFGLAQEETYKKIILQQRAKKFNLPPPPQQDPKGLAAFKFILMVTLLRPARMLVSEPIVALLSVYTAFNFSVMFAFFAAFPLVFQSPYPQSIDIYHFNKGEAGLVFLGIGIGCFLAVLAFVLIDRLTYQHKMSKLIQAGDTSKIPPEERLYAAMFGAFLLPLGLFWFGWSARRDVHWIVPVLATIPFGMGNWLVFASIIMYLVDTYESLYGASAAAANGLLRYTTGAVFPLFTIQMYKALGVAWASSVFGFVTVGLCLLPFVFYQFGPRIRGRSAYA